MFEQANIDDITVIFSQEQISPIEIQFMNLAEQYGVPL